LKLVVVDDYPLEGRTIEFLLKQKRPDITYCGQAMSGTEGLELILRENPEIAIIDVKMPGMDGLSLTKMAVEQTSHINVIILSAFSDFNYAQQALRLGAIDYLLKPLKPEELFQVIEKVERLQAEKSRIPSKSEHNQADYPTIPEDLIAAILSGSPEESGNIFNEFWKQFLSENNLPVEKIASLSIWLSLQILQGVRKHDNSRGKAIIDIETYAYRLFLDRLNEVHDIETISAILAEYVLKLAAICNDNIHDSGYEQINRSKALIEENLHREITLNMIAQEIFISPYYLSRLFKKCAGISFINYVINRRLEKSKYLLMTTNETIEKIAMSVGYEESNSFRRLFKKEVGISPKEFRNQSMKYKRSARSPDNPILQSVGI
jgi:two-component system response regulator YesN